ncbi:MAG: putative GFO/IDH/MocA family oxidoreductase [Fibrobacteres bacterium]|nr:putative GFO/IDH/MocA family oxidoreductase [Fibrobacterota bacterium]
MESLNIGIIGAGLMGREIAAAAARGFVLDGFPIKLNVIAASDIDADRLNWFGKVPGVKFLTRDYRELLKIGEVDAVYAAVPHHLHREVYADCLAAGKDLLAEKPFGMDLHAAKALRAMADESGLFVRCSSEFPFYPGPQHAFRFIRSGALGNILEVKAGFLHSSDLDPMKAINWKRQAATCGEIGVMGDLGMHVTHLPLRLGWKPVSVYAQLQKVYSQRPDGRGGMAECDTWDNAMLHTNVSADGNRFPMTLEMKRIAPGETNTWYFHAVGTKGGVRYSTKEPKTLWTFSGAEGQAWQRQDLGFRSCFPTITGAIFEPGFPDSLLQMLAAFAWERSGRSDGLFACATPEEALASHELFAAALVSHRNGSVVALPVDAEARQPSRVKAG